jgi:hypothetical protein
MKRIAFLAAVWLGCSIARAGTQQTLTVHNPNSKELTHYTVRVDIDDKQSDFWAKAAADGSNVRFTDEKNAALGYYLESIDPAAKHAVAWVNVPSIPAGGDANIRLAYGEGVKSGSSGADAFIFFDDFSKDKDLSGWLAEKYSGNGTMELVDGWARVRSDGDFADGGNHAPDTGAGLFHKIPDEAGPDYAVEMRLRQENWDTSHHGGVHGPMLREDAEQGRSYFFDVTQADSMAYEVFFVEGPYHQWLPDRFPVTHTDQVVLRLTNIDGVATWWGSDDMGNHFASFGSLKLPKEHKYIGLCDTHFNGYIEYGWVRIRKCAAEEPTISFGGK